MMWKRSIVQAKAYVLALTVLAALVRGCAGADLVIEIPGAGVSAGEAESTDATDGGQYRLDYRPPHGSPAPNFTVPARASTINFQGLPGTKYHFMLYYSNETFADLLTWNQTIITAPEPPSNLTVTLGRNKQATIAWSPPAHGSYTGFRFRVVPLSSGAGAGAAGEAPRNVTAEGAATSHTLRDLAPGATYTLHAFTLLHDKESAAYASRNFTTKPNTPGKFIVWFRNETTLLVLWQPPYPPGAYTHYKVSIVPPDARDSELYVEKEGEPPGPAQAAFKGLVPGRAYNISVQTVSEPEISAPTTAQYRTVPLRPANVSLARLHEGALRVRWAPPLDRSEFDKYQVSLAGGGGGARATPLVRARSEPPEAEFDALEPGAHYTVTVKTMSGKVTSWPQAADLTLKPLPVVGLKASWSAEGAALHWEGAAGSTQDSFQVSYHEAGPARDDANSLTVAQPRALLDALLPGRNYSVQVAALSRGVASNESSLHVLTPPLAPVLRELLALPPGQGLRLAWSSDVNSRQDSYEVRWRRADDAASASEREWASLETKAAHAQLERLHPGAVYELRVAALAHGLRSEPHKLLKPTRPLPPASMSVSRATSNSAVVRWSAPPAADSALGQFVLRYRTAGAQWTRLPPLQHNHTEAEIVDMTHGERYDIQLDTASLPAAGETVESGRPLSATHTVRPNPVSDVAALVDTRNMTLEWPRPKGRVEWYALRWRPTDPSEAGAGDGGSRNVSAEAASEAGVEEGAAGPAEGAGGAGTARALVSGLAPGVAYRVSIAAHAHDLASDLFTMDTRTRPLIQSEMTIVTESDDGDDNSTLPAFLVVYTKTPASASQFDAYRFRLEATGETPREQTRAASAPGQQLAFRGLVPGRLYNLTMWTLSRNVTSHPVQRQARLYPRPIPWLNASEVGARQVQLAWGAPWGVYTDFLVQWLDGERLEARAAPSTSLTAAPLRPHTRYEFTVEVRAGSPAALLTRSRATSVAVTTAEAPPGPLRRFQPTDSKPNEVTFSWELPDSEHNGVLRRIVIQYGPEAQPDQRLEQEFPPTARSGTVSGLRAGASYEFVAWAESGAGAGGTARWAERTAIAAPPRPAAAAVPAAVRRTSSTVAVRFRADYFSPANGNVTAYTLVVAEQPAPTGLHHEPARLPSWRDVSRLPVWPPYQVTEPYFPFVSSPVEEFTLGSERCEEGGRAYCNGPLKPNTRYYVKLRAFTAPDKYTDTAYAQVYTEADNTAWIVGGCVSLALAVCAAGAGAALRRRRGGAGAAQAAGARADVQPLPRVARPVRVSDFIDHYRLMSADSDFRFSEEFEELKHVGREQPCTAADLPCNRPKNRFTNILPYDHSRYKLQPVDDEEGSDYINANFVPGFHSPREFIVTQGPLHCTRDDFWRMCWESGARAVVMLTRCVEKGREKCDRYWPYDTRPVYYGDIAVTALNESRYPDWTVTELAAARGAEQRVLLHFHFTTWPDFGVPSPPTTLARFVRAFRERLPADGRPVPPVVVHCSAGVGRSGTFIALDRALAALAARHDALDVFHIVYTMRRERVWMVQTEQQYICIHQCLVAVLEGQDLAAPPLPNHHLNQAYEDDEGIAESGM